MDFPPAERPRYRLKAGDLLVCEGGAGVGRAAIWQGEIAECYYQKSLHRVRSTAEWPVEWLLEWIRISTWIGAWSGEGNLATIPHLTAEQLRAYRLPFPKVDECWVMLRELRLARRGLNDQRSTLTKQVGLLAERRHALIAGAVTGALKIPGIAG
jgi:type I restriction enzyme, S subunit